MGGSEGSGQLIELSAIVSLPPGVSFDSDNITLHGAYEDELSAYRARRVWQEVLEETFLLEGEHDFVSLVSPSEESHAYILTCRFTSACARYAFWRITNNQAPEAQYIIETAHIPQCDSRAQELILAPDLRPAREDRMETMEPRGEGRFKHSINDLFALLRRKIRTIAEKFI